MSKKSTYESKIDHINYWSVHDWLHGVGQTYKKRLKKYGVTDFTVDCKIKNKTTVNVEFSISFSDEKFAKKSMDLRVDASDLDVNETFLTAMTSLSTGEVKELLETLDNGRSLSKLEPVLYDYLCVEYAANCLPNEEEGGEWQESDEREMVELFSLKKV